MTIYSRAGGVPFQNSSNFRTKKSKKLFYYYCTSAFKYYFTLCRTCYFSRTPWKTSFNLFSIKLRCCFGRGLDRTNPAPRYQASKILLQSISRSILPMHQICYIQCLAHTLWLLSVRGDKGAREAWCHCTSMPLVCVYAHIISKPHLEEYLQATVLYVHQPLCMQFIKNLIIPYLLILAFYYCT